MNLNDRWQPGQLIGERYRIDAYLAEGGAGEVYSAQNVWTSRLVAVKRLLPELQAEATLVERFLLEGRIGGKIEHPNIVQVLDMGREASDGSLFIVQELLRGDPLRVILARQRRLSVAETMDLMVPIIGALVAVHQQGIVHRDIKPENIYVLEAPFGQRIPKLLDFGIAKVHEEHTLTRPGSVMGTLGYMPPEQLEGSKEVDRRADVWSVGIVLYELLAGAHPFEADNFARAMYKIMNRNARELYDIVPRCPKGISDIVQKTLRKNRQERPDSMLGLLEELLRWSREEPDEHLRSLVSRHRLSIPSSLEQRILTMDVAPLSRGVRQSSGPQSWSRAPVAGEFEVDVELESQMPPPIPEDDDDTQVGHNPELAALIAAQEVGRLRVAPELGTHKKEEPVSRREGSIPQLPSLVATQEQFPAALVSPKLPTAIGSSEVMAATVSPEVLAHEKAATAALEDNDFLQACRAADLICATESLDPSLRASMHLLQARACFWLGDATRQEDHAFEAFNLAPPASSLRFQAAAELAMASSTLGKLDTLLELVDELIEAQVAGDTVADYLIGCCRLGIALQRAGWPEHVERVLGRVQGELAAQAEHLADVRAWSLLLRAELADHAGDHGHSLSLMRKAASAFLEQGDTRWACVCEANAGAAMLALGGYDEARSELAEAIRQAAASKISQSEIMRLNLGLAEARGGDAPAGLERLRGCLASLGDSDDWRMRSAGHRYLAEVLLGMGKHDEAEREARASVELAASPALRAQALAMLALIQLPRPMEAFMAASQAMGMLTSVGGVAEDEARIRLAYAMSLDAMGHADNARDAYEKARDRLLRRADRISDPKWRGSFLGRVSDHERTLTLAEERCSEDG